MKQLIPAVILTCSVLGVMGVMGSHPALAKAEYEGSIYPVREGQTLLLLPDHSASCRATEKSRVLSRGDIWRSAQAKGQLTKTITAADGEAVFKISGSHEDKNGRVTYGITAPILQSKDLGDPDVTLNGRPASSFPKKDRKILEEFSDNLIAEKFFAGVRIDQGEKINSKYFSSALDKLTKMLDPGREARNASGAFEVLGETETASGRAYVLSFSGQYQFAARGSEITLKYEGYLLLHKNSGLISGSNYSIDGYVRSTKFITSEGSLDCSVTGTASSI